VASSLRINFKNSGVCEIRVRLTDSSGNIYEFIKRVRKS
jgi:hypothetical protein